MDADQIAQIIGALLVLAGFVGAQMGRLDQHSPSYLAVNLVGAGVLSAVATLDSDWGFLLLEGVWFVVSAWGLARTMAGRRPPASAS